MYNPYYYHMNKNANRRANNNQDNNLVYGDEVKDNTKIKTKTISCDKGFNLGEPAPKFTLQGIVNGQPKEVSLSDYRGKWVVVFFYGSDFTFV